MVERSFTPTQVPGNECPGDSSPLSTGKVISDDQPASILLVAVSVYIVLPVVLFMLFWLPPASALACLPLIASIAWGIRPTTGSWVWPGRRPMMLALTSSLLFALVAGLLGGPFSARIDWLKHAGIAGELSGGGWPVLLEAGKESLHYYFGFYIMPALAEKVAGVPISVGLTIWTLLGMSLAALLLIGRRSVRDALLVLTVFALASGWDVIGCTMNRGGCSSASLEWWSGFAQVSSPATALLWRPNQALPALLLVLIARQLLMRHRGPFVVLPLVGACLLWSPFVVVGLTPLLIGALLSMARRSGTTSALRSWFWPVLATLPTAAVLATYLVVPNHGPIPQGPVWDLPAGSPQPFAPWPAVVILLIAIEVGPLIAVPWLAAGRLDALQLGAVVGLGGFALYSLGAYNDLLLNAALPSVLLLATDTARWWPEFFPGGWRDRERNTRTRRLRSVAVVCLFVGAITPLVEGAGSLRGGSGNWAECRTLECIRGDVRYQYVVESGSIPAWLVPFRARQ
jgi:hypothetical protein